MSGINTEKNSLVSIIIPTYNRKAVISRAIDSCQCQTYKNIEIVICDDHSNDGTLEFIKNKYRSFRNIQYCTTPENRKGANAARNEGIKKAHGDIIAFLDSDDYLLEDSIETRLNTLLGGKSALVYGDVYTRMSNSRKTVLLQYRDISLYNQKKFLMQELSLCITSSIMVRKSALEKIGYMDETLPAWQDDDLIVSIGMKYKIEHCKRPVAVIVSSRKSVAKNKENLYLGCKNLVEKYKEEIISYASLFRYCLWKIRIIYLWAGYKEEREKARVKKTLYRFIYYFHYKIINKFFWHV